MRVTSPPPIRTAESSGTRRLPRSVPCRRPGIRSVYGGIEESGTPLALWRLAPKQVSTRLESTRVSMTLPVRDMPTRAELEAAIAARPSRVELEKLERAMDRRAVVGDDAEGGFYFTVWRLGDAFILATPAEPYSRFQMDLVAPFPDTTVAVLDASDGFPGAQAR